MPTKTRPLDPEKYWRDDDYYIVDEEEPPPRRLSRAEAEAFGRRHPLFVACVVIFMAAFCVRVLFNLQIGHRPITPESRDAYDYDTVAKGLLEGKGFERPWAFTSDRGETVVENRPTMFRPPLFTYLLTFAYSMTNRSSLGARILLSSVGSLTCVVIFLLGRRVFSHKVGFLAGLVAAAYPFLWIPDAMLLPEALYTLLVTYTIYRLYCMRDDPIPRKAIVAGAFLGLAGLTRSEGMSLLAMAGLFVFLTMAALPLRRRFATFGMIAVSACVVYAPWAGRNWAEFKTLSPSSNVGGLIAGANNRATYYDRIFVGYWYYGGLQSDRDTLYRIRDPRENEKTVDDMHSDTGAAYASSHAGRIPIVVGARVLRGWDLWAPYTTARLEEEWGRPTWATYLGLGIFYPALVLAAYGAWRFWRNWRELLPFYYLIAFFTLLVATTYGTVRFRVVIEPVIVLFATATLYGLLRADLLERSAPLRALMLRIRTDVLAAEADRYAGGVPDRMARALRLRAAREARLERLSADERALLPEGEELEWELEAEAAEYDVDDEAAEDWEELDPSFVDDEGVLHVLADESGEGGNAPPATDPGRESPNDV